MHMYVRMYVHMYMVVILRNVNMQSYLGMSICTHAQECQLVLMLRNVNLRSCSGMSICAHAQECQFALMLRNQASLKHALHEDIS